MITRIISIVFLLVAIFLGYYLVNSVKSVIDEEAYIKKSESTIIEKLKLIRDTEVAYQLVHGKYTSDWDSLISFLDSGTIYITERREEIIPKEYGTEEIILHIDTVGNMTAKEFIFTELYLLLASDTGVIQTMNFKVGDNITKNYQLYTLQTPLKLFKVRSQYEGVVTKIDVGPNTKVNKGDNIAEMERHKYPMTTDISRLAYIPGTDKKFDIFADKINRSGVWIDVFEVKDVSPVNPERRKNNNEKALRVGSRTDVTIAGNWE